MQFPSANDSDHYVLQLLTCARTLRDWSVTMAVLSVIVTAPSVSVVLVTNWPLIIRHVKVGIAVQAFRFCRPVYVLAIDFQTYLGGYSRQWQGLLFLSSSLQTGHLAESVSVVPVASQPQIIQTWHVSVDIPDCDLAFCFCPIGFKLATYQKCQGAHVNSQVIKSFVAEVMMKMWSQVLCNLYTVAVNSS